MTDDGGEEKVTIGLIRQVVKEALGEAGHEANKETETRQAGRRALSSRLDRDSEIESRVEAAVKQIRDQEDRQRKDDETASAIKALQDKIQEKPPVERSWAHKLMGWGD